MFQMRVKAACATVCDGNYQHYGACHFRLIGLKGFGFYEELSGFSMSQVLCRKFLQPSPYNSALRYRLVCK